MRILGLGSGLLDEILSSSMLQNLLARRVFAGDTDEFDRKDDAEIVK